MTDKLAPCQKCGCADIGQGCDIGPMESKCYCVCTSCGARGPYEQSQEQAQAGWNGQQMFLANAERPAIHWGDSDE